MDFTKISQHKVLHTVLFPFWKERNDRKKTPPDQCLSGTEGMTNKEQGKAFGNDGTLLCLHYGIGYKSLEIPELFIEKGEKYCM